MDRLAASVQIRERGCFDQMRTPKLLRYVFILSEPVMLHNRLRPNALYVDSLTAEPVFCVSPDTNRVKVAHAASDP